MPYTIRGALYILWEEFHNINDDGIYQRENESEGSYGGMLYASIPAREKINVAEHDSEIQGENSAL